MARHGGSRWFLLLPHTSRVPKSKHCFRILQYDCVCECMSACWPHIEPIVKLKAKTPIFPFMSKCCTKRWTELAGLNSRHLRIFLAEKRKVTLEVMSCLLLSLALSFAAKPDHLAILSSPLLVYKAP